MQSPRQPTKPYSPPPFFFLFGSVLIVCITYNRCYHCNHTCHIQHVYLNPIVLFPIMQPPPNLQPTACGAMNALQICSLPFFSLSPNSPLSLFGDRRSVGVQASSCQATCTCTSYDVAPIRATSSPHTWLQPVPPRPPIHPAPHRAELFAAFFSSVLPIVFVSFRFVLDSGCVVPNAAPDHSISILMQLVGRLTDAPYLKLYGAAQARSCR